MIGSFLTLVYGMAVGALAFLTRAPDPQYLPILWPVVGFLVVFPFCILIIFTWLVVRHTDKLYSPGEFGEHKPSWMTPPAAVPGDPFTKPRRTPRRPKAADPEPPQAGEPQP